MRNVPSGANLTTQPVVKTADAFGNPSTSGLNAAETITLTTGGAGAFIGSNTALVAPVTVGAGAIVGAGSTITRDVAEGAVATARGEQTDRPGAAKRLREMQRMRKARNQTKE